MRDRRKDAGNGWSRRDFLKAGAAGGGALLLPVGLTSRLAHAASASPAVIKFEQPLAIPAEMVPEPGTSNFYIVTMQETQQEIVKGTNTTVWGFGNRGNLSAPGPSFRVNSKSPVTVEWRNSLALDGTVPHRIRLDPSVWEVLHHHEPHVKNNRSAVMHLHGGIKLTQRADGYPLFDITPGERDTYVYPVDQEAATLWYHDHTIGKTRLNVYMGLAGFFIVQGDEPAAIPSGRYDVPLVFQDRRLNGDGQLAYDRLFDDMFFGDVMVVNGRAWPYFEVEARRYRFRLLNGSNTRNYTFQLADGSLYFDVIGSDGGLLPAPARVTRLTLTPGERADIVVDFAQPGLDVGDDINLINLFHEHEADYQIRDLMQFRIRSVVNPDAGELPAALRSDPLPLPEATAAVRTRQFKLEDFPDPDLGSRWLINNKGFAEVDDVVQSGDVEIWEWLNKSDMIHPMHIHNVHFRVLGRWKAREDSKGNIIPGTPLPLDAAEAGAKDTVRVGPLELVRVVAKYERAGTSGELFPFHCHVLEHEDYDMMRQYKLL